MTDKPVLPEFIWRRASARVFTGEKVGRGALETLLEAGMSAPSAKNVQPWWFFVVTRRETLDGLAESIPNSGALRTASAAIMVGANLLEAGAGTPGLDYWIQDCAAASQNILLAAAHLGLGSVWIGLHPSGQPVEAVRELLKLPEHVAPLNLIAVGYTNGEPPPMRKYDPAKVLWEE